MEYEGASFVRSKSFLLLQLVLIVELSAAAVCACTWRVISDILVYEVMIVLGRHSWLYIHQCKQCTFGCLCCTGPLMSVALLWHEMRLA